MAIRVIKSSGDVYADLGIKKPRNPHHGSTLDSFLAEEAARRPIAEADADIAAGRVRKRLRAGKQKVKRSKPVDKGRR